MNRKQLYVTVPSSPNCSCPLRREVDAAVANCKELLDRIRAYQFALYDLELFMDSHPNDQQAHQLRAIYREKLSKLINAYEQHYGPLVITKADVEGSWDQWVCDPWPWDNTKGAR